MIEAIFLNPVSKKMLKTKTGNRIKSPTLKRWQAVVKKHGGDMKAAAREWKSGSKSRRSRRHSAGALGTRSVVAGLSGLAARRAASRSRRGPKGGVPMAARKTRRRRRNQLPPTAAWVAKWRAGMVKAGRTPKSSAPTFTRISSEPVAGQQQWKGRYKKRLKKAMRKHARRKSRGAKSFASAVRRGITRSTLVNPVNFVGWRGRFVRSTGFAPYRKTTKTGRKSRRRYGPRPMTKDWKRSVSAGVRRVGSGKWGDSVASAASAQKWQGNLLRAMKNAFPGLGKKRRKAKKGRRRNMARYPMIRRSMGSGLVLALPKRSKRRRSSSRRSHRRMKNPVASSLRALATKPSLTKYAYVTGGVVAGGVLPNVISRYIWKGSKSELTEALIGVASSALAGLGVAYATKNDENGVLVAAGGLAAVVGNYAISKLNSMLGFAGLGQAASDALKSAVEAEMQRAGLTGGVGQFMLPSQASDLPGTDSMGQFLTEPELQTSIVQTEGFGQADLDAGGSAAFAGIDGSVF